MTYKSKLTLFVDLRKAKAIAKEQKQTVAWYLEHMYAAIRLEISGKKGATFDCFTLDKAEADKLELEFNDIRDLKDFLRSGSYKYLREVLGEPMDLRKRDFDKKKRRGSGENQASRPLCFSTPIMDKMSGMEDKKNEEGNYYCWSSYPGNYIW